MPPSRGRAEDLARLLVSWPSVTGTAGEAGFPLRLAEFLRTWPAFSEVRTIASHGETASVAALARGSGRRTLILAGHFDVVSIANYGDLGHLAFEAAPLAAALIADLEARPRSSAEDRALADLLSGDFLPGRGMADMKSGLAAGLAAIERWADSPERAGNILFVATPDEENRSRGMRSFRDALPSLAREWDIDIVGGINLDVSEDDGDGSSGRALFFGTVGKFSPFAHVVGRATHAGYPYGGVSAHLISAAILRAVESKASLSDTAHGEASPPPVCLEARDFREAYDVTTPEEVWLSFNWLTHGRSPGDLLPLFASIADEAGREAVGHQMREAQAHGAEYAAPEPRLVGAADLVAEAERRGGEAFQRRHDALVASLGGEDNPLAISRTIVRHLVREAALEGPAIVIGLSSLFYPQTHVDQADAFRGAVLDAAARIEDRHSTWLRPAEFFQGISDMSFFGHRPHPADAASISEATIAPTLVDRPPPDALAYPVVNVGPWGRQLHQRHERVYAPYAFEILPDLLHEIANSLLGTERFHPGTGSVVEGDIDD